MSHNGTQMYTMFYRELGVRRFNELLSPRLNVLSKGLPRNSILHHYTPSDEEMFPDAEKHHFQEYGKRIPLDMVYTTELMEGNPRKIPFVLQKYVLPFIKKHNIFRYVPDAAEVPIDERTLIVVNYNPLKFAYRYVHTPISDYQRWEGFQKTLWSKINDLAGKSNKQHFIFIDPFKNIPSFNMILNFSDKDKPVLSRLFNTNDKRFILHLSNFINDEFRERSVFNVISKDNLKRVNLIFTLEDGRCSVLNLAHLYSWIKGDENVSDSKVSFQRDQKMVTRAILKYFLILSSSIPEDASEAPLESDVDERDKEEDFQEEHTDLPDEFIGARGFIPRRSSIPKISNVVNSKNDKDLEVSTDLAKSLDDDMKLLESQANVELSKRGISIKDKNLVEIGPVNKTYTHEEVLSEITKTRTANEALRYKITQGVHDNTLNAASYKKALQDTEAYTKMLDPYGSGKLLSEKVKINPQEMVLSKTSMELVDNKLVLDKSMNKSALQDFTRGYIKNHYRNDVLKAIDALQKGGVIVQKHEINIEHNVMGSVETHNVELKPINGTVSSIWFKLPVVEDDGSFKVAGSRYQLRKQICELPLRKISPTEVSLTSYYGKCFVSSENKVANSSSAWLLKQLEKASFEGNEWIKDIVPGDMFNNETNAPYIYGVISTRFSKMTVGDMYLTFGQSDMNKNWPPSIKDRISKGMVYSGFTGKEDNPSSYIFIDVDNRFYKLTNKGMLDLGDVYQVLKLNPLDSPIRFSELALFRKNVPVGIVLGYRLGWSKLLALLKVKPRFVEPRKRLELKDDEYPIPFIEGTYIFSRKDQFATMILAGFMDYAKTTKNFSVNDFDYQDIYLNLLSSKGLGAIYIREIDMLFDYFIDPITEEILQDMGEPRTFEGLLLKATEMLMSYKHPKNYDGAYSRIRGYERFSGTVYKELTAAIRQFRSKNIAGRSKINIGHYKIWQSINEDQSKMMVQEINPMQDLKNDEGITYVGEGGRSSESINKASRSFHINDIGVISEGTVDSNIVGVNIFSSSDPNIRNYRGIKDPTKKVESTNKHSSSVLLAPAMTHDDQLVSL